MTFHHVWNLLLWPSIAAVLALAPGLGLRATGFGLRVSCFGFRIITVFSRQRKVSTVAFYGAGKRGKSTWSCTDYSRGEEIMVLASVGSQWQLNNGLYLLACAQRPVCGLRRKKRLAVEKLNSGGEARQACPRCWKPTSLKQSSHFKR